MSKHADQVESLATKGDSHQSAHTHNFQQEAQSLLGGMAKSLNHAALDVQHIDFTDPFKKAGSAYRTLLRLHGMIWIRIRMVIFSSMIFAMIIRLWQASQVLRS